MFSFGQNSPIPADQNCGVYSDKIGPERNCPLIILLTQQMTNHGGLSLKDDDLRPQYNILGIQLLPDEIDPPEVIRADRILRIEQMVMQCSGCVLAKRILDVYTRIS